MKKLLVSEAQDSGTEQDIKFAAVVQNAVQFYCVIYDEEKKKKKKELLSRHPWIIFSRGEIELSPAKKPRTCAISIRHEWNCSLPPATTYHC